MGKKKKKKGKKKERDPNAPPPEDPLDKLTGKHLAMYKDLFGIKDLEKKGVLNIDRVVNILQDMTEEKVDGGEFEDFLKENAVKKEEGADEDAEDEINYPNFMKIAVMFLNESQHEDEVIEAFKVLQEDAFRCIEVGIDEREFRFLLSKIMPPLNPKEVKQFLEYNQSKIKGIIKGEQAIRQMREDISNPIKAKKGKGKK